MTRTRAVIEAELASAEQQLSECTQWGAAVGALDEWRKDLKAELAAIDRAEATSAIGPLRLNAVILNATVNVALTAAVDPTGDAVSAQFFGGRRTVSHAQVQADFGEEAAKVWDQLRLDADRFRDLAEAAWNERTGN